MPTSEHGEGGHVAGTQHPSTALRRPPDTLYPTSHVGWHVAPDATFAAQSPTPPCTGALEASHTDGKHVAAASVPALQLVAPDTQMASMSLLPVCQHCSLSPPTQCTLAGMLSLMPDLDVQSPTPPCALLHASHGFAEHVAALTPPALISTCPMQCTLHHTVARMTSLMQAPTCSRPCFHVLGPPKHRRDSLTMSLL